MALMGWLFFLNFQPTKMMIPVILGFLVFVRAIIKDIEEDFFQKNTESDKEE